VERAKESAKSAGFDVTNIGKDDEEAYVQAISGATRKQDGLTGASSSGSRKLELSRFVSFGVFPL